MRNKRSGIFAPELHSSFFFFFPRMHHKKHKAVKEPNFHLVESNINVMYYQNVDVENSQDALVYLIKVDVSLITVSKLFLHRYVVINQFLYNIKQ